MAEKQADRIKASARYAKLESERDTFLKRAQECSALTIPAILPPTGFSASSPLPTPYQSLGARGVRTLASKFLLSMFPDGVPFFNYRIDDQALEKLGAKRGEFEKALASRERACATELDTSVFRPVAFQAFLHLVVTGNVTVYIPPKQEDRAQVYRLSQYVSKRDAAGNLLELIIKETLAFGSLPDHVKTAVQALDQFKGKEGSDLQEAPVDLYTCAHLDETGSWIVYQEAADIYVDGTEGTFKKGELPYLVLRFSNQPGEHYGRSYVEEYLGDLDSLEALSEALVEGSAAAARIVFLVDPAGTTSIQVVAKAKTGDVRAGRKDDVSVMQLEKAQDLSVAKQQAEDIAARLSYAFLLHSSIQRQGERVTAEEIRFMAGELDDGLGGVYTLFAADFQLPAVRLFEKRMEKRLGQPKLPKETVHPVIVTGLEAIGRGHSQRNLQAFAKEIIAILTPEIALRYLNASELISRSAAAYSLDTTGLIKSEDEIEQAEQQAQVQAMLQHLGPQAIQQLGGAGQEMLKAGLNPQQGAPAGPAPPPPTPPQ